MPRFKQPAPPPPSTPKLKTPLKSMNRKDSGGSNLSLVAAFDDLMRNSSVFHDGAEKQFLVVIKSAKEWQNKWRSAESERQRLKILLNEREKELATRDMKIKQAREMVNVEMRERQKVEQQNENLQRQWAALQDLVNDGTGNNKINNETLDRIRRNYSPAPPSIKVQRTPSAKRNYYDPNAGMAPLVEQSAESLIDASELSFDDSKDDLLDEPTTGQVYKRRSSNVKKVSSRRSHSMGGEKFVATATVSFHPNGHTEAEAMVETPQLREMVKRRRESREKQQQQMYKPSAPTLAGTNITPIMTQGVQRSHSKVGSAVNRPHKFQKKKKIGTQTCNPCGKRIKFQKEHLVCQDCGLACHLECKLDVGTSCLRAVTRTPTNKGGNFLADYAPLEPPMIPAIVEATIEEVSKRGIKEVGIYRVPGSEKDAKELMEKLAHGKGPLPDLSRYEIQTVASALTKFLRNLKEPVIPLSLWQVFVDAASINERIEAEASMYQAISELPQPNRDTLAYIILHLQMVADNQDKNKMGKDNLARCMGPTIVGYSSATPGAILSESEYQLRVMDRLLNISEDYWKKLLEPKEHPQIFGYLKASTPETMFAPVNAFSPNPRTGGPARRTRSKQHNAKQTLFQSPMIY